MQNPKPLLRRRLERPTGAAGITCFKASEPSCGATLYRRQSYAQMPRAPTRGAVRALAYGSNMEGNASIDRLLNERRHLTARIEREREQLDRLRIVVSNLEESIARAETTLSEVDSLLGRSQGLRAA